MATVSLTAKTRSACLPEHAPRETALTASITTTTGWQTATMMTVSGTMRATSKAAARSTFALLSWGVIARWALIVSSRSATTHTDNARRHASRTRRARTSASHPCLLESRRNLRRTTSVQQRFARTHRHRKSTLTASSPTALTRVREVFLQGNRELRLLLLRLLQQLRIGRQRLHERLLGPTERRWIQRLDLMG